MGRFLTGLKKRGISAKIKNSSLVLTPESAVSDSIRATVIKNMDALLAELTETKNPVQAATLPPAPTGPAPNAASRVYADYPDAEMQRAEDAYSDMIDRAVKAEIPVWFWETGEPKPKTEHVFLKPAKVGDRYTFTPMIENKNLLEAWL